MPRKGANGQVPRLLGDLRQAARFGDRKQIRLAVSDSNRAEFEEGMFTARAVARFDVVVHDPGNASADADEREAGAVVGLITAEA